MITFSIFLFFITRRSYGDAGTGTGKILLLSEIQTDHHPGSLRGKKYGSMVFSIGKSVTSDLFLLRI